MPPVLRYTPLVSIFIAGQAQAHAFELNADSYEEFVVGVKIVFSFPELLLPTVAFGLLASLWTLEGLLKSWVPFIAGTLIGLLLSVFFGPGLTVALIALGVLTATLAAVLPRHTRIEVITLAALTGLLVGAVGLDGHGPLELGLFFTLGIFAGANLALAISAGVARIAMEHVPASWMRIGIRIAASWVGAVLMLILAFTLSS